MTNEAISQLKLSPEQKKQLKLITRCRDDIIFFVENFIIGPYNEDTGSNYFITNQQRSGLIAVQDLANDKRKGERREVLGVSIQSGKGCHAKGTKVLTHNERIRNVEDIEVGDKLMGPDSKPREVLSLCRGREQMYRIKINDGSYYDVNESHILSLRACENGHGNKWGDIINVTVKDYLSWSERKKKGCNAYKVGVDYEKKDLKIPPYILGIWLGDGDSDSARLINPDEEVINEWKRYGDELGCGYKCYNEIDHRMTGKSYRNPFLEKLRSYNLINQKHIPANYIFSDREDRLELLAGLIDTDGCVRKKGSYNFSNSNKRLAEEVLFLARSLGFRGRIGCQERINKKIKTISREYTVNISRGKIEEIPLRVKRKQAVSKNSKALNFNFEIEKLEVDDYYGFELDGDHLYLLSDFSATHNTGKDAMCSWVILWFMFVYPNPKIPCISVSADQLDKVLWSEISKWLSHSHPALKDNMVLQSDKLFRKDVDVEKRGKEWFAFKKAANPKMSPNEQVETLQGIHEEYMLQVVDEGSGILDPVFNALEANMTGKCNFMLIIFNPMHVKGYAIETQQGRSDDWVRLHWNAEDSEIVDQNRIRKLKIRYGEESNTYRMNVKGLPPLFDEETLINWDWVMSAIDRGIEVPPEYPLIKSLDCGAGGDNSIIAKRRGNKIYEFKRYKTSDSAELANWAGNDIDTDSPDVFRVDTIGIGWAVEGDLRSKKGPIVEAADVRRNADNPERFHNKRAEMYWTLRELFEKGAIDIPDDSNLKDQIAATRYDFDDRGRIKIIEKKKIRNEIGHSPDELDALALLYFYADDLTSKKAKGEYVVRSYNYGWMSA